MINPQTGNAQEGDERFVHVMGQAVIALWSNLPQPLQEQLFERAVRLGHRGERDEMLREQLAKFLHDHHKRTAS
jgi:predicted lipid carrier protein YhbT